MEVFYLYFQPAALSHPVYSYFISYAILEYLQSLKRWKYRHWLSFPCTHPKCSAEKVLRLSLRGKLLTQRCLNFDCQRRKPTFNKGLHLLF